MFQATIASDRQETLLTLLVQVHGLLATDPIQSEALLEAAVALIPGKRLDPVLARTPRTRLQDLVVFIDAHITEPLSLERLADQVGLSRSQLARSFRAQYAMSLQTYIRGRRVGLAQARLRAGPSSLAQVALDCGFSDQSHLSRTFRDIAGISPGRWRMKAAALDLASD